MLMLLKEKSRVAYKPKDRKKFKPYLPEARNADPGESSLIKLGQPQDVDKKDIKTKKIKASVVEHYDTEMKK